MGRRAEGDGKTGKSAYQIKKQDDARLDEISKRNDRHDQ
jgi:hypothetical protein